MKLEPKAYLGRISAEDVYRGRDGAVRWTAFRNLETLGHLRITAYADWCATDKASAQWVATIQAEKDTQAFVWAGWDDGVAVYLNETLVLDRGPKKGSGTKSAKHPKGRSGFWFLTPFSSVTIDRNSEL